MPHFLNLPLTSVIEALCLHCSYSPTASIHEPPCEMDELYTTLNPIREETKLSADLASLCLTSKLLNALATPFLYHRPMTTQWGLLARTLLAQPYLGERVKHLKEADWSHFEDGKYPECPPEVSAYLDKRKQASLDDTDDAEEDEDPYVELVDEKTKLALLISLCPNIELLEAVFGDERIFILHESLFFPRLSEVKLTYSDTEDGIDFESLVPLTSLAPNLSTLYCDSISGCEDALDVTFENLTTLKLHNSAISAESLLNILGACPRLEHLEYQAGGATVGFDHLIPRDAQQVITEGAPSLKALRLDLYEDSFGDGQVVLEDKLIRSLVELDGLEHLSLDGCCLIPHRDPHTSTQVRGPNGNMIDLNGGPLPESEESVLVNLLPASMRDFHIQTGPEYGPKLEWLLPAIFRLASVARERFPELRIVRIPNLKDEDNEGVTAAFREAGVEVITKVGLWGAW